MKRTGTTKVRSPAEARAEFRRKGISVTAWAMAHGFSPALVEHVLSGRRNPTRGQTHRIAVMLRLKEGVIADTDPVKAMEAA